MDVYPYIAGSTVLREDLVDGVIDILITGSRAASRDDGPHAGRHRARVGRRRRRRPAARLKPGDACYFQMHEDDVRARDRASAAR